MWWIGCDENDENELFLIGRLRSQHAQYELAIACFDQAMQKLPPRAELFFNRGNAYMLMDKWDEAIADFTEAIHLRPSDMKAYFERAGAYLCSIHSVKAQCSFCSQLPDLCHFCCEHLRKAIRDYSVIIRTDDLSYRGGSYFQRGTCYALLNKLELAVKDFTMAIQFDADSDGVSEACLSRAECYVKVALSIPGNAEEHDVLWRLALADYLQTTKLNPFYTCAYVGRASAHMALGEWHAAVKVLHHVIQRHRTDVPQKIEIHRMCGVCYRRMGNNEQMKREISKANCLRRKQAH